MKRRGCSISIEGMEMEWGTLWLKGWEVGNKQQRGGFGPPTKNQAAGAWFQLTKCRGWLGCQSECPGVGECGVKVVEVHNQMACKGGVHLGSLPKTKPPGLGFGQ